MKRTVIISIIIIIILGLLVGLIGYSLLTKKPIIIQPNTNEQAKVKEQQENIARILSEPDLYLNETIETQKIPKDIFISLLNFSSFCNSQTDIITLKEQCAKTFGRYFSKSQYENTSSPCLRSSGQSGFLYFIKINNQDKFLKFCNEFIASIKSYDYYKDDYDPGIIESYFNDCNLLWQNKFYEEKQYCDEGDCYPLLTDEQNNQCQNKISLKDVNLNNLTTPLCKQIVAFRKAAQEQDCLSIDNTLTKLICLASLEKNICPELKDALENLKLPDFVAKYQLQALQ